MRRALPLSIAFALGATPKVASAGDSEMEIANARQLAIQGIDAVEGGNCRTGEPLLERAERLHHATVHLQYLARCKLGEGHLVAATEMWRQIIREGAPPGSSPAVQAAIAEANAQLPRTLPRLASTTVRVKSEYANIEVKVDGSAVPPELLGAQQVIDPGEHQLEADAPGFAHFSKHWSVAEGKTAEVVIVLAPTSNGGDVAIGTPEGGTPATKASGSGLRTAGFIVGSAGLAAMVAGTVTLLTWKNKESSLADKCTLPGGGCDPKNFGVTSPTAAATMLEDEKSSIHTLTTLTNVFMFGGGALVAGGITLIVIGSTSKGTDAHAAIGVGAPFADFGVTVRGAY